MTSKTGSFDKKFFRLALTGAFLVLLTFSSSSPANAACIDDPDNPQSLSGLACTLDQVFTVLMVVSGAAFVAIILYGSIKLSLSQGDFKGIEAAKMTLTWGLIGFLVVVGTATILAITSNVFGASLGSTIADKIVEIEQLLRSQQDLWGGVGL